jgi:hypothetical protein
MASEHGRDGRGLRPLSPRAWAPWIGRRRRALRAKINAGRLGPSTRVLHIAAIFQQRSSVPIGVFTGALETSIGRSYTSLSCWWRRRTAYSWLAMTIRRRSGCAYTRPPSTTGPISRALRRFVTGAAPRRSPVITTASREGAEHRRLDDSQVSAAHQFGWSRPAAGKFSPAVESDPPIASRATRRCSSATRRCRDR